MAAYSYKDVLYQIPAHIEQKVVDLNGFYDGTVDYDGDCWTAVSFWIDELQDQIASLKAQLAEKLVE